MVASFSQKIQAARAADLRRAAAQAAIEWQAAYLAGQPAEEVDRAEKNYLGLIAQAKFVEGGR